MDRLLAPFGVRLFPLLLQQWQGKTATILFVGIASGAVRRPIGLVNACEP